MLRAERQQHAIVARGCLQLEVERCAEAFPQRQSERAVHPAAERRVHDELHPAAVVEEAFEDDVLERRHDTERGATRCQVLDHHRGDVVVDAGALLHPGDRLVGAALRQQRVDPAPQLGHLARELLGACGRFAEPERHRRRRAVRIHHTHRPGDDAADLPRGAAEEEDVARRRFDRPVLVDRADERVVGLGDDAVVTCLRNRTTGRQRCEARTAPRPHLAVDAIAVEIRGNPAAAGGDAVGDELDDAIEVLACEVRERRRPAHQLEEVVLLPALRGALGHDLLREDVERQHRRVHRVERATSHTCEQRRALDELVAGHRIQTTLRRPTAAVPRAADALQERRDAARRGDLADHLDRSDVDPQLQRCRRDQRAQLAGAEL